LIGKIIKRLRKDKNITQADLAKAVGVTTSSIGMYETEVRKPSYEVIVKLAKYFNVTTDYLLNNDNNIEEKPIDKINKLVEDSGINTIAAHFEGEEFTEDDKEDIENFIKYVLSKKKKKK